MTRRFLPAEALTSLTQAQAEDVIGWLFGGDESDVKLHTVKIVKTRAAHKCMCPGGTLHEIPIGSVAIRENAVVDDRRCSSYVCMPCALWSANDENLFGQFDSDTGWESSNGPCKWCTA